MATWKDLDERVYDLSKRSVLYQGEDVAPATDERHPDCFLTWPPQDEGQPATTLGPYPRWLIAAWRIMESAKSDQTLSDVLGLKGTTSVDRTFLEVEKFLRMRYRYEAPPIDDDVAQPVLTRLLKLLNERYAKVRGGPIEWQEFLQVQVPLDPGSDQTVGTWPIEWLDGWICRGNGTPSQASYRELTKEYGGMAATDQERQLLSEVLQSLRQPTGPAYKRIINVAGANGPSAGAGFAAQLATAVMATKTPTICISLRPGSTRAQVVRKLYAELGLDTRRLADLDSRAVELASDLELPRIALTMQKAVVIFHGWDNLNAPLHALQQYLFNTSWDEFLRVLAQPYHKRVLEMGGKLQPEYQLVVLSTQAAHGLAPWVKFVAVANNEPMEAGCHELTRQVRADDLSPQLLAAQGRENIAEADRQRLLDVVARRLIAASINGIRRDTLRRCLEAWMRMFWPTWTATRPLESDAAFNLEVERLLKTYAGELTEVAEDELERLPASLRSLELDLHPRLEPRGNSAAPAMVVTFDSRELRSCYISQWLEQEQAVRDANGGRLPTCSWAHINMLLAEECMRQVTSQLRHRPASDFTSPSSMRRAVQAVYHGLMSLDLSTEHFSKQGIGAAALYEQVVPIDAGKRYLFLYAFLYRHLIEHNEWRLGRSFGKSDLRLDLLCAFVMPQLGKLMFTGREQMDTSALLPTIDELGDIPKPLRDNPQMWCDLLEAIGRAGCDLGGPTGHRAVEWALSLLPGGDDDARINALLPSREHGYYRIATSALKLRVDSLQFAGDPEQKAQQLCLRQLGRLGLDKEIFDQLARQVANLLTRVRAGERGVTERLQQALADTRDRVLMHAKTKDAREDAADFLFRFAEILANKADNPSPHQQDPSEALRRKIDSLAYACAMFWVADRIRSEAGVFSGIDEGWPLVGAKAMRDYVRVSLKLARLLAEDSNHNGRIKTLATRLLEHAQNRMGVYTRHLCQFQRERNSMLMLEVSRVRTWMRVVLEYQRREMAAKYQEYLKASDHNPEASVRYRREWVKVRDTYVAQLSLHQQELDFCSELLREVENSAFLLGFRPVHVRRLTAERIKTITAMMKLEREKIHYMGNDARATPEIESKVAAHVTWGRELLDMLDECSVGSPFWAAVTHRQRLTFARAIGEWPGRPFSNP